MDFKYGNDKNSFDHSHSMEVKRCAKRFCSGEGTFGHHFAANTEPCYWLCAKHENEYFGVRPA